jgi:hypothetical protein
MQKLFEDSYAQYNKENPNGDKNEIERRLKLYTIIFENLVKKYIKKYK